MGSGQQAMYDELRDELRQRRLTKLQAIRVEALLDRLLTIQADLQRVSDSAALSKADWNALDSAERGLRELL